MRNYRYFEIKTMQHYVENIFNLAFESVKWRYATF